MTASEKLDKILLYLNINAKVLSERMGYNRPQIMYDIQKGKTKNLSSEFINKLISAFPMFNRSWLMSDEGDMLLPEHNEYVADKTLLLMKDGYTCQSIKDRMVVFLKTIGEPLTHADRKCGFSIGYIRMLKKNPSAERVGIFLKNYPSLSRDWLMSGEGEMLLSDYDEYVLDKSEDNSISVVDEGSDSQQVEEEPPKDYIPLLPSVAHGGRLSDFSPSVSRHECEVVVSPVAHADFAMQVLGNSMEPEIPNGSRIFIKRIDEALFLEWGKVYVLDTPNGVIVKKVMPTDKEGIIECISHNTAYPPFKVDMSRVFGVYRVLAIVTLY